MLSIYQSEKLKEHLPFLGVESVLDELKGHFEKVQYDIDVTFVSPEEIQESNKKYRKIDQPTDVLSFQPVIDIKEPKADVLICYEYILQERKLEGEDLLVEITRMIIHGVLHIMGMDHKKSFDEASYEDEAMYLEQERILKVVLNNIKF